MAELCKQCFIATWNPNAYDREHIVMSDDNEHCEGCWDCGPYVKYIDSSDIAATPTIEDFVREVTYALQAGRHIACVECGSDFVEDDLAFAHEIGECPYCHMRTENIWIKT